jgi:hypothetical protein
MRTIERWTRFFRTTGILLLALSLIGCSKSLDSAMWACQLDVQKGNAGKSAEAATERGREITACMEARGYRLDTAQRSCQEGAVTSGCYLSR